MIEWVVDGEKRVAGELHDGGGAIPRARSRGGSYTGRKSNGLGKESVHSEPLKVSDVRRCG